MDELQLYSHNYTLCLSLEILKSWIDLIDEDGWVAREQILGEEARSKVAFFALIRLTLILRVMRSRFPKSFKLKCRTTPIRLHLQWRLPPLLLV